MQGLRPTIESQGYVLLDGGLASELERRGEDLNDPLWSARVLLDELRGPSEICGVHAEFFQAGADVATTATYQASFKGLMARGLTRADAADVFRRGVSLAVESRDAYQSQTGAPRQLLVAASLGSYGASLHDGSEYRGNYAISKQGLFDYHSAHIEVMQSTEADVVAFETVPSLAEVEAIVDVISSNNDVRCWISVSCHNERELCDGSPFAEAVRIAANCSRVDAVGVNCCDPQLLPGLLSRAREVSGIPLVAYPNRGGAWDAEEKLWSDAAQSPEWATAVQSWRRWGAAVVGGCCRVTPADIATMRSILEEM